MRKLLYTTAALIAVSFPAQATELKPYVGFDLLRYQLDYSDDNGDFLADGLNGANIHAGIKPFENFGLELGYFGTKDESQDFTVLGISGESKTKVKGVTLDALGYLPVDTQKKFELIGTVGVSWSKATTEISALGVSEEDSEKEIGWRAGLGAQYSFTPNWNVRGLARYQSADFDDIADKAMVYSAGMNYSF